MCNNISSRFQSVSYFDKCAAFDNTILTSIPGKFCNKAKFILFQYHTRNKFSNFYYLQKFNIRSKITSQQLILYKSAT